MEHYTHANRGTCSRKVEFDLDEEGRVYNVKFLGGCNGNLKGIGLLVDGMPAEDVVERVSGLTCGPRPTSCPDQLARALREAVAQKALAE